MLFTLYFLVLFGVCAKLFFEARFDATATRVMHWFAPDTSTPLVIGFSDPLISMNPLTNDTGSRARLLSLYEPLVRVNRDLGIEPALAISYGALDDLTWEFRLRPEVMFHNATPLVMDDVIFSLQEARDNPSSGVQDLASALNKIIKVDETTLHLKTDEPDPLLLQKLSSLLIFPKKTTSDVVGTGPYHLVKDDKGTLTLERFENYWGIRPIFGQVVLKTFASKSEKLTALNNNTVDIVANVPPDTATIFDYPGFTLNALPTLEVNFLMFHFGKTFKPHALREAVALTLDKKHLARLVQGFATPADQFVGNGIFGFDPTIPPNEVDIDRARELVNEVSPSGPVEVTLDLPKGLDVFAATIKDELKKIGISVTPNFLTSAELSKKIVQRRSEFYFFGWRSDLGDASDFLTAVVHSPSDGFGQFNGGNYKNNDVDRLIELSRQVINAKNRLEKLREVMYTITVDDIIGVPLFSPQVLYGVSTRLKWKPRVDGYILAQEVKV